MTHGNDSRDRMIAGLKGIAESLLDELSSCKAQIEARRGTETFVPVRRDDKVIESQLPSSIAGMCDTKLGAFHKGFECGIIQGNLNFERDLFQDVERLLVTIEGHLEDKLGGLCEDHDPDCPTCQSWAALNALKKYLVKT